MTEKEQIEEMAEAVVCSAIVSNAKIDNEVAINLRGFVDNMYRIGYRKIDDDCDVITKDELKQYKAQAVKEFAEKLKEKFSGYEATYYNGYEEGFHDLQEEIDELLKEYDK